jgi:NADH-quinone oxidoreductase subunit H
MESWIQSLIGENVLVYVVSAALPLLFFFPYALVTIYVEMKVSARIQNRLAYMRTGWKGTLQPIADVVKLLQKEDIIPSKADRMLFILAPYVVFAGTYATYAALPFSPAFIGANIDLGIFYLTAIGALVSVGILMVGWASANKFSTFGAIRTVAQIISYEIPIALGIVIAVMIIGSLNLNQASIFQDGGINHWVVFGGGGLPLWKKLAIIPFTMITTFIMLIAGIAEVNRTPFDLPEAESELVQGYLTELSGMKFAMFYLAEFGNMFVVASVVVSLFLGGWSSPFGAFMSGPFWGFFWFVVKGMLIVLFQIWVRWTLPRLRVDQLVYVSWKVMVPFLFVCLFAVGLILVV